MVLAPCGIIGDVDGDGDITQADVNLAFSWYGGINPTPDQLKRLDVNANGRFDANDIVLINEYVTGQRTTFPACHESTFGYIAVSILATVISLAGMTIVLKPFVR